MVGLFLLYVRSTRALDAALLPTKNSWPTISMHFQVQYLILKLKIVESRRTGKKKSLTL